MRILKPYDYFEYLLTGIPKHLDEKDSSFCENLLPWSDKLPANCRMPLIGAVSFVGVPTMDRLRYIY
uniref:hypothetical protein n=1 Tax=Lachnotalea glycerini TaxID=1763509 RepID=UPI000D758B45|nr:hypothetical protein [Lachnotalea glycerini]